MIAIFKDAFLATQELLSRDTGNPERIFEHGQSAFWVGYRGYNAENYDLAQKYFQSYLDMAEQLEAAEGRTERAQLELAYAYTNLGSIALVTGKLEQANILYVKSLEAKKHLHGLEKSNEKHIISLAIAYSNLASVSLRQSGFDTAIKYWEARLNLLSKSTSQLDNNAVLKGYYLSTLQALSRLYMKENNFQASKAYLREGLELSQELMALAPQNLDYQFEHIFLLLVEFEISFLEKAFEKASSQAAGIRKLFSRLPSRSHDDYQYNILQFPVKNLAIYLAASEGDVRNLKKLGAENNTWLKVNITNPSDVVIQQRYALPTLLLTDLVHPDTFTHGLISQFCNNKGHKLNYGDKLLLGEIFAPSNCEQAVRAPSGIKSATGKALHLIKTLNSSPLK